MLLGFSGQRPVRMVDNAQDSSRSNRELSAPNVNSAETKKASSKVTTATSDLQAVQTAAMGEGQTGYLEPSKVSGQRWGWSHSRSARVTFPVDTVESPGVERKTWKGATGPFITLVTLRDIRFHHLSLSKEKNLFPDPTESHITPKQAALTWTSLP